MNKTVGAMELIEDYCTYSCHTHIHTHIWSCVCRVGGRHAPDADMTCHVGTMLEKELFDLRGQIVC